MIISHAFAIFWAMLITFLLLGFQLMASLIQWRKVRKQVYDKLLRDNHSLAVNKSILKDRL